MADLDHDDCYRLLGLKPGVSFEKLQHVYRQKIYALSRTGSKADLTRLKEAYTQLAQDLEEAPPTSEPSNPSPSVDVSDPDPAQAAPPSIGLWRKARLGSESATQDLIREILQNHRIPGHVSFKGGDVILRINAAQVTQVGATMAQISTLLRDLPLNSLKTLKVYGLNRDQTIAWQRQIKLVPEAISSQRWDRFSFDDPMLNTSAYPLAFIAALVINTVGILQLFHLPLHIWIHEFGHATVAWFSGRRAIPLPFGWTNYQPERSLFVYFGILFLLGLLFWSGWRERLKWPMGIAVGVALLQFWMTWMTSVREFEMWFSFGGIGGEFYLSLLLMISFYFPMPDRWRWDFWRFPVLVIAMSSFWKSFWTWHRIERGQESIPWGTIFGGQGDAGGDMNQLNWRFGWSPDQIIDTYNGLGHICLLIALATYGIFLVKLNPRIWLLIRQKTMFLTDR